MTCDDISTHVDGGHRKIATSFGSLRDPEELGPLYGFLFPDKIMERLPRLACVPTPHRGPRGSKPAPACSQHPGGQHLVACTRCGHLAGWLPGARPQLRCWQAACTPTACTQGCPQPVCQLTTLSIPFAGSHPTIAEGTTVELTQHRKPSGNVNNQTPNNHQWSSFLNHLGEKHLHSH